MTSECGHPTSGAESRDPDQARVTDGGDERKSNANETYVPKHFNVFMISGSDVKYNWISAQ